MIHKFRAWDKKSETIDTVRRITWTNGSIADVYLTNAGLRKLDQIIIMQSTGLKDKNGKYIFEGDILKFTTTEFNGSYFDTEHIERVEFSDGAYFVGTYFLGEVLLDDDEAEVMGSIYENPELCGGAQ